MEIQLKPDSILSVGYFQVFEEVTSGPEKGR